MQQVQSSLEYFRDVVKRNIWAQHTHRVLSGVTLQFDYESGGLGFKISGNYARPASLSGFNQCRAF